MNKNKYLEIRNSLNFEKSNFRGVSHFCTDICLLLAAYFLSGLLPSWIGPIISGVVCAAVSFRAFSIMHEAVHGIACRSPRGNDFLGHFFGAISFLPYAQWKTLHLEHHLWTGNVDRDPTMKILKNYRDTKDSGGNIQEFGWKWWMPVLAVRQQVVFWSKSVSLFKGQQFAASSVSLALMFSWLGGISLVFGAGALVVTLFTYLSLIEIINFPHHLALPQGGGDFKMSPLEQFKVARTAVYMKWFNHFVLLNFNYHVEHHLYPTLPWHQLPKAHEMVRSALASSYNYSYGHGWLKSARRQTFEQILSVSVGESPDQTKNEAA